MVYYLKIAGVGVKVNCPNNLYLFDEWKIFFEEKWGKAFLVEKIKPSVVVFLNGIKIKGAKSIEKTIPKESIKLPEIKGEKIYFDNLLNPGYLLLLIKDKIESLVIKKGGIVMHASGVVINNKTLLIMGESGSGKTTALKKMMDKYKPIAEDEVMIEVKDNNLVASSLLFSSKLESGLLVSGFYKVGGIITIRKNNELRLQKMSQDEAFQFLLEQSKSLINTKKNALMVMKYAKLLSNYVYKLYCQKEDNLDDIIKELNL